MTGDTCQLPAPNDKNAKRYISMRCFGPTIFIARLLFAFFAHAKLEFPIFMEELCNALIDCARFLFLEDANRYIERQLGSYAESRSLICAHLESVREGVIQLQST